MKFSKKVTASILACTFLCSAFTCFSAFGENESYSKKYEAEEGTLSSSGVKVRTDIEGYSGTGYVGEFSTSNSVLEIPFEVPSDGKYQITVVNNCSGNYKENNAFVDNKAIGTIYSYETKDWQSSVFYSIDLTKGEHTFKITKNWGYFNVDYILVENGSAISSSVYDVDATLCNPNANDDAKRLMRFLVDNYGTNVITGQYCSKDNVEFAPEYTALVEGTGKAPAILGFDMMEYSTSRLPHLGGYETLKITENAIKWATEFGGIVTYCWHWTPAEEYLYKNNKPWYSGFYTDATTFDIKAAMSGEDEFGYDSIIKDIDAIAVELQKLEDAGVAVLWRPLHEASGGWFWWGTDRESCIDLWKLLYDRLTNVHGLDNLIWVWNGQRANWYPGDEYVDIIGEDIYADNGDTSSQMARFNLARSYSSNKMICLSENGVIPDIDNMKADNILWSWFAVWNGSFIHKNASLSGAYTPIESIIKTYNSENVVTLDELPDLKTYPLEGTDPVGTNYVPSGIKGDINADKTLDIVDVVLARSHIVGNSVLSQAKLEVADMNGDNDLDILDVVLMRAEIVA